MRHRHIISIALGVALLVLFPVFADLAGNGAVTSPPDNLLVAGTLFINTTFPDLANITILYNETDSDTYGVLNSTDNRSSPYNFSWQTANGSFADGHYNITIILVNATNASDSQTLFVANITVDNTGPFSFNVSTPVNLTYKGVTYVNASPVFWAAVNDPSGISFCEYARNNTDSFSATGAAIIGNSSPYPRNATCQVSLGSYPDQTVFNITFRARDQLGNIGLNSTRGVFVVDASPPSLFFNNRNGSIYADGMTIPVSVNVTDAGINVTNGTACAITIDSGTSSFIGGANYSNATGQCAGVAVLKPSSGLSDGVHTLTVAANDTLGNANSTSIKFIVDNTPPEFSGGVSAIIRDLYTPVNFTFNVNDTNNVSMVWVTNGSFAETIPLVQGTPRNGTYNLFANMSDFACLNESLCRIFVFANDTLNNTVVVWNSSDPFTPLLVDTYPPIYLSISAPSSPSAGNSLNFSVVWSDISLSSEFVGFSLSTNLSRFNGSAFVPVISRNAFLVSNQTNFSFPSSRSDEGKSFVFEIALEDWDSHLNTTDNITVVFQNQSPTITPAVPNDTIFAQNSTLFFTATDLGSGFTNKFLSVNMSLPNANFTINSSSNSSYFNCSCPTCGLSNGTDFSGNAATLSNWTCILQYPWPLGNVTLGFTVTDAAGNINQSTYRYFVTNIIPDIINITIDGYLLPQTIGSTGPTIDYAFSNESADTEINWSVVTNLSVTSTSIAFLNTTPNQAVTFLSVPNGTHYNLTAGKSSLLINASAGSILLFDTLQLNLVANVPLNLSAIAAQYTRGIVAFNTYLAGQLATGPRFVNSTTDIVLTVVNTTAPVPYAATINYTGLSGLSLRWNATQNAFAVLPATSGDDIIRGGQTNTNITVHIKSSAPNWLFFDQQSMLTVMTFNFSILKTNLSVFYTRSNVTTNTTILLVGCSSLPTSAIADAAACYVTNNVTNTTTLYLPRFDQNDEVFFGDAINAPLPSFTLPVSINQSVIPLVLTVKTVLPPYGTFCVYNLSKINTSGKAVSSTVVSIPFANFTLNGTAWQYAANIQGIADYNSGNYYNLSVNCTDAYGRSGRGWQSFSVNDITKPSFSQDPQTGSITMTSAIIVSSTDEFSVFTVRYGPTPKTLSNLASGSASAVPNDNISLLSLDLNTRVYYNVSACDAKAQCTTVGPFSFMTLDAPSGSGSSGGGGGGGGGGGVPVEHIVGKVETSDVRTWSGVTPGQTITYETRNGVAFTGVTLHFTTFADNARMTIRQFKDKPESLPGVPLVYKYLHIEHSGVVENTDTRIIDFTIPKQWLDENKVDPNDVALYRYESNAWVAYKASQKSSSILNIVYNVSLPGFSYFAIAKYDPNLKPSQNASISYNTTPGKPVVLPPSPSVNDTTPNDTVHGGEFQVNDTKKGSRIPTWLVILGIAVLVAVGSVFGLQQYKKYQERSSATQAQLREEYSQDQRRKEYSAAGVVDTARTDEHDPMAPAHHYIDHMRMRGMADADIREKLISVGWDPVVVDLELLKDPAKTGKK